MTLLDPDLHLTDDQKPLYTGEGPVANVFDGDTGTFGNMYTGKGCCPTVLGVELPAPAQVYGVWAYTAYSGMYYRYCYFVPFAAVKKSDIAPDGSDIQLAGREIPNNASAATVWHYIASTNRTTFFSCVYGSGDQKTGALGGSMAEIKFIGATEQDRIDAGYVYACDGLVAEPVHGGVRLTWTGGTNVTEVAVQRRPAGTADWTTLATGVSPSGRAFVDETARTKYLYDYRLVSSGLNGLMLVPSPTVVTARALPKGVAVMLR